MSAPLCARCGAVAETYNFENDSTFWGWITNETTTVTTRRLRLQAQYFRRNPEHGNPMLVADERQALCGDCWGDLVGCFMQGRAVNATRKGWR